MTEVPPPTRRTRKDVETSSTDAAPSGAGAMSAGAPAPSASVLGAPAAAGPVPGRPAVPGPPPGLPAVAGPPPGLPAVPGPPPGLPAVAGPALDDDPERLPTAQLEMAAFGDHLIPYVPPVPPAPRSLAPWSLALAILALTASLFTGWLLLLGVVAIVFCVLSLRRRHDSRRVAGWALSLTLLSLVFSVGWLIWGFSQLAVV